MYRSIIKGALALAIVLLAVVAISERATAQVPIPNACCTFTVDVAGFAATCFPVKLTTRWTGGIQSNAIGGNGVFVLPITFAPCPPVPAQFAWASLNGGVTKAWFNFPANFVVNGCCFTLRIATDASGCIIVYMRPC